MRSWVSTDKTGVVVQSDLEGALASHDADVVALCTGSTLPGIKSQLEAILAARLPIVSTTEELSFPQFSNEALTEELDKLARDAGVAVVGTGVNPGFAMDTLPVVLSAPCERVDSVTVDRIQDASVRRIPFQQKIGAGLEPDDFRQKADRLEIRHVGLDRIRRHDRRRLRLETRPDHRCPSSPKSPTSL